jgi:hypothetical protein
MTPKSLFDYFLQIYTKMMTVTFLLVIATNFLSLEFNKDRSLMFMEHPEFGVISLFLKSVYFGILWPALYITALTNPHNAFVLWGSMNIVNGTFV